LGFKYYVMILVYNVITIECLEIIYTVCSAITEPTSLAHDLIYQLHYKNKGVS
jgi:hypothetical protein